MITLKYSVASTVFLFLAGIVASQNPETNDQFTTQNTNGTEITNVVAPINNTVALNDTTTTTQETNKTEGVAKIPIGRKNGLEEIQQPNFIIKLYNTISSSVAIFFNSKKVASVLRNIGTCIVNGAMEILTYYLPAPMMPLIASAAGMLIPFEPVVVLREKMPVTSYRRAFNRAVNSFMGTFNEYKVDDVEDPYMTRRFNRRFMNDKRSEKKVSKEYI